MGFFLRKAKDTSKWAKLEIEAVDMEPPQRYMDEVGYWKHQCFILCDFDWRKAKDMYDNAPMEEVVQLIRGRYHYYNAGDK